jgi:hypothetical protein
MSSNQRNARRQQARHTWPLPAVFALLTFAGAVASNLVASDLDQHLKPYRPVVYAVCGLALIATIVATVRDSARPQPPPLVPELPQLQNVVALTIDAEGTATYSMAEGGQIIGRITDSVVRPSKLTADPSWEHSVTGEILNFTVKPIVIRRMNVLSEIDNEVLTHYGWRSPEPLQIIEPNTKVDFSLVFWPLDSRWEPGYLFYLKHCLTKVLTETTAGGIEIPVNSYSVHDPLAAVEAGILSKREAQVGESGDFEVLQSVRHKSKSGFGWKVRISVTRGQHPLRRVRVAYVVVADARHVVTYGATTDDEGEFAHLDYAPADRLTLDVVVIKVEDRLLWIKKRRCVITKETPLGRIEVKL